MASYKDKKYQKMMATESGKIAFAIHIIEHPQAFGFKYLDFSGYEPMDIYDGIRVQRTEFGFYVEKWIDDQYDWFYKIVRGISYKEDVAMLDAQHWVMYG